MAHHRERGSSRSDEAANRRVTFTLGGGVKKAAKKR